MISEWDDPDSAISRPDEPEFSACGLAGLGFADCRGDKHRGVILRGDTPIAQDTPTSTADVVGGLGVPAVSEAQWVARQARRPGNESESHNGGLGAATDEGAEECRNSGCWLWRRPDVLRLAAL